MTPMVYTVLQLVTRGREKGISTVALGKTTGYDQKTIHYLIAQLIKLDLVYVISASNAQRNTYENLQPQAQTGWKRALLRYPQVFL
jgi:hypothetical protein